MVPFVMDRPVTVYRDGQHTVTVASLYRGACLTVQEEPAVRFAPYVPHPNAPVSRELSVLLAEDRVERAARKAERAAAAAARRAQS